MTDIASDQPVDSDRTSDEEILDDRSPRAANLDSHCELQYPQLLLNSSFHSLLTNSYPTSEDTAMPQPSPKPALGDSWASLSDAEYGHDDDSRSENTDAGSLLDAHGSEDVHSVNDEGESSEYEEKQDHFQYHKESDTQQYSTETGPDSNDDDIDSDHLGCLTLDESVVASTLHGKPSVILGSKLLADIDPYMIAMLSHSRDQQAGKICMTMSTSPLEITQRPFQVLFFGAADGLDAHKAAILRKIGGALVAGQDHVLKHSTDSPFYHVVPSEFGPGAKPRHADLIPIPTQMVVNDCVFEALGESYGEDGEIKIEINDGTAFCSRSAIRSTDGYAGSESFDPPDVFIVLVGRHDTETQQRAARLAVEFADRHFIPKIVIERTLGPGPGGELELGTDSLHVYFDAGSGLDKNHRRPIDAKTFALVDSEQLNRHLNHLIQKSECNAQAEVDSNLSESQSESILSFENLSSLLRFGQGNSTNHHFSWVIEPTTYSQTTSTHKLDGNELEPNGKRFCVVNRTDKSLWISLLAKVLSLTAILCLLFTSSSFLLQTPVNTLPQNIELMHIKNSTTSLQIAMPLTTTRTTLTNSVATISPDNSFRGLGSYLGNSDVKRVNQVKAASQKDRMAIETVRDYVSWLDANNLLPKKLSMPNEQKEVLIEECQPVTIPYKTAEMRVPDSTFVRKDSSFEIFVRRGKQPIFFTRHQVTLDDLVISINPEDYHGALCVTVVHSDGGSNTQATCVRIDLQNSWAEAVARWTPKVFAKLSSKEERRLSIIRIRPEEPSKQVKSHTLQLKERVDSTMELFEKAAIKQIRDWYWKDVAMLKDARQHVSAATLEASNKAREVAVGISLGIRRNMETAQNFVSTMHQLVCEKRQDLDDKAAATLSEAQRRARKIVGRH